MPDLLQTIADRTTLYAMDLASAVQDDLRTLKGMRHARQLKLEVSTGAEFNEYLAAFTTFVERWTARSEEWLRVGMDRHDFEVFAWSGSRMIRTCLAFAEEIAALWDQLESAGASAGEVTTGRDALAATRGRMLAVRSWFDRLEELATRKPPDIDPALIEKGAEDIRQGRFVTGEQIRQSLRNGERR